MLEKQEFYCLSHTSSPFYPGYFGDRILRTVCLGWPQNSILLISASQVARIIARIIGVSHRCPAGFELGLVLARAGALPLDPCLRPRPLALDQSPEFTPDALWASCS
jgi:hypothetical protein